MASHAKLMRQNSSTVMVAVTIGCIGGVISELAGWSFGFGWGIGFIVGVALSILTVRNN